MGIIRVKGYSRGQRQADRVELTLTFNTSDPVYEAAYNKTAEKINRMEAELAAIGFAKEKIVTQHFSVTGEYESFNDPTGNWQQRFKGYSVNQVLQLHFAFENEKLEKVMGAVALADGNPEIQLSFTITDQTAFKNELLRQAVADASAKAAVLAAAAGKELGALETISYGQEDHNFSSRTEVAPRLAAAASGVFKMPEIRPAAISCNEMVDCVWQLKD